jgi:adenosylmethionine-8-amino-7-oxononanoate aminotransferase
MRSNFRHRLKQPRIFGGKTSFYWSGENNEQTADLSGGTLVQTLSGENFPDLSAKDYFFIPSYGYSTTALEKLEERIDALLGHKFPHQLWVSSGSDAIEAVTKLILNRFREQHQEKPVFAVMNGCYHGNSNFAGMLNTRPGKYNNFFGEDPRLILEGINNAAKVIQNFEKNNPGKKVAGLIIEPLAISGAAFGYPKNEMEEMVKQVKALGVPVVFDEIASGCFRLGHFCYGATLEHAPDFTVLSKGLSNGYYPVALILLGNDEMVAAAGRTKLSFGHTFGLTPVLGKIVDWMLDQYRQLQENGSMTAIQNRLQEFARQGANQWFTLQHAGLMCRIVPANPAAANWFRKSLQAAGIILYETPAANNQQVFIICPYYDMEPEVLNRFLEKIQVGINSYIETT